jgi:hypothetical protein
MFSRSREWHSHHDAVNTELEHLQMAFWSKWFSSTPESTKPIKTLEYKDYKIEATPYKEGGQWQLAGVISKNGKSHCFVRADKFSDRDEAADIAISKGQLIVDQMGEGMFKP